MKRIVLTCGLVSGGFLAGIISLMPLYMDGTTGFDHSMLVGYASMVLAFLSVFFGIRAYRERTAGGSISFGKAFQVGILITLITCVMYVVAWEIVYFNFMPDFVDNYSTHMIEKLRASGATPAAIAAETQKMAKFKELYANPFINVGMTFMEVFPAGLIITLVSAAILRRKPDPGLPAPATA